LIWPHANRWRLYPQITRKFNVNDLIG